MTTDNSIYHSGAHCRYLTQYHIVWCPKFRYSVLGVQEGEKLKNILQGICGRYSYGIKAMEVMPDHIHLFIDAPQTVAPCDIVRTLKSVSTIEMFQAFPKLKKFYARCGSLWQTGYFISTIGQASEETVAKYIAGQKHAKGKEPEISKFTLFVEEKFRKHKTNPPACPTWDSDVETFHWSIERDCLAWDDIVDNETLIKYTTEYMERYINTEIKTRGYSPLEKIKTALEIETIVFPKPQLLTV